MHCTVSSPGIGEYVSAPSTRRAKFSHPLVWPLELGLRTLTFQCGHLSGHAQEGDSLILRWVAMMGGLQGQGACDRPICWAKKWEVI